AGLRARRENRLEVDGLDGYLEGTLQLRLGYFVQHCPDPQLVFQELIGNSALVHLIADEVGTIVCGRAATRRGGCDKNGNGASLSLGYPGVTRNLPGDSPGKSMGMI